MNTRTIVSGAVTLGAPLYLKDEYQGKVVSYFKPNDESKYDFIEIELPDEAGYKLCIIEGNNIFVPYDAFQVEINDSNIELWCGYHGLIGAGDINDGSQTYYRTHGNIKERVDPKSEICNQYESKNLKHDKTNNLWQCVESGSVKILFDFYQDDSLKYFIPVAFYKHDYYTQKYVDIYRITAYYCNPYSLNNLF